MKNEEVRIKKQRENEEWRVERINSMGLNEIREQINVVNDEMLGLFLERMRLSGEVAEAKKE